MGGFCLPGTPGDENSLASPLVRAKNVICPGSTTRIPSELSPDGKELLFTEEGEGGGPNYSVYLRKIGETSAVRLGDGQAISVSPDGKWVITSPPSAPAQLVLLPTGPGEAKPLTHDSISHTPGEVASGWPALPFLRQGARSRCAYLPPGFVRGKTGAHLAGRNRPSGSGPFSGRSAGGWHRTG